jgi:hypothetical protein
MKVCLLLRRHGTAAAPGLLLLAPQLGQRWVVGQKLSSF